MRGGDGRGTEAAARSEGLDAAAGKILLDNVYGWFARAERGVYVLTDAGHTALLRWPQAL